MNLIQRIPSYRTAEARRAATLVWLQDSAANGRGLDEWSASTKAAVDALATDPARLGQPTAQVGAGDFWWVDSPRWEDKFYGLLADRPTSDETGKDAWRDVRTPVPGSTARLVELAGDGTDTELLGAFGTPTTLRLFDPRTGLWELTPTGARADFAAFMTEHYPGAATARFRAYLVPVRTLVHTTYLGPPATNTAPWHGVATRPDVDGARQLHTALQGAGAAGVDVRFHCLRRHRTAFRALLPAAVDVRAVEDEFPGPRPHSILLSAPDLQDLHGTTDYIVRTSVRRQEAAERTAQRTGTRATKRHIVNAKNVWSLYCLWRFGGYHLDSGVLPTPGAVVRFPQPDDFGIAFLDRSGAHLANQVGMGGIYVMKARIDERPSPFDAVLKSDVENVYRLLFPIPPLQPGPLAATVRRGADRVNLRGGEVDVWLMRSPAQHPVVRRALEAYLRLWFIVDGRRDQFADNAYASASRSTVISSVLTGMAPADDRAFWAGTDFVARHHVVSRDQVVAELGVEKFGFGSHR